MRDRGFRRLPNNKRLAVLGLLTLCVTLAAVVFMLGQSPKGEDVLPDTDNPGIEVTPGGIDGSIASVDVPAPTVNPGAIIPQDSTGTGQNGNDIPLTVIPDKPEPPKLPDTAPQDKEMDGETWDSLDPALKDPDVKPDMTPAPPEPQKPDGETPNSGDTNDNGQIYIPGFGWVENEGGGQGQPSGSDGDWDKQIGSM